MKPKYDKTITERSQRRREQQEQVAKKLGFVSWSKMQTDILRGRATVIKLSQTDDAQ